MFHTTPQLIVKDNIGQCGPGEMREDRLEDNSKNH